MSPTLINPRETVLRAIAAGILTPPSPLPKPPPLYDNPKVTGEIPDELRRLPKPKRTVYAKRNPKPRRYVIFAKDRPDLLT